MNTLEEAGRYLKERSCKYQDWDNMTLAIRYFEMYPQESVRLLGLEASRKIQHLITRPRGIFSNLMERFEAQGISQRAAIAKSYTEIAIQAECILRGVDAPTLMQMKLQHQGYQNTLDIITTQADADIRRIEVDGAVRERLLGLEKQLERENLQHEVQTKVASAHEANLAAQKEQQALEAEITQLLKDLTKLEATAPMTAAIERDIEWLQEQIDTKRETYRERFRR